MIACTCAAASGLRVVSSNAWRVTATADTGSVGAGTSPGSSLGRVSSSTMS